MFKFQFLKVIGKLAWNFIDDEYDFNHKNMAEENDVVKNNTKWWMNEWWRQLFHDKREKLAFHKNIEGPEILKSAIK